LFPFLRDSLFRTLPQAKVLFGFPLDMNVEATSGSRRFLTHAAFLIEMIEKALNMLGKADDDLTVLLTDLGVKHIRYGVKTDYFVHMKRAIIAMLQEKLGMKLTEDDVTAWDEVLSALISDMTKAQREQQMIEAQKAYKK
jgi:hemoglobin-like flavoprotein